MENIVTRSSKLNSRQWESYTQSFNSAFNKNFSTGYFTHKYINTIDHDSYHSLLIEKADIVGGCTIIPYYYFFGNERIKTGLAVDVFIHPDYRSDPYSLFRMYQLLKDLVKEEEIAIIIAVPNDLAYSYWKSIVKWKDIGTIPYYAFPLKLSTVLNSGQKFWNYFSISVAKVNFVFNEIVSRLFAPTQHAFSIAVDRTEPVLEIQRYTSDHFVIKDKFHSFAYRVLSENQVQTAYLIDFYNKDHVKDLKTLLLALKYIMKHHQIDLLMFVGKLSFFQTVLLRLPYHKEPKHLFFMGDILSPEKIKYTFALFNYRNWDFGLFNYDVR